MSGQRRGATVLFSPPVSIAATGTAVGPKEGQGPLGPRFDRVETDELLGQGSWEQAEVQLFLGAARIALAKAGRQPGEVDLLLAGDLLNQIVVSNFAAAQLGIPFLGLYNACASLAEGLALGAMLLGGGMAQRALVVASSHHLTSERQYRFPVELGVQRTPTAQWTTTGAGALLLEEAAGGPAITAATLGTVQDLGIKDVNNMGAAMAPAAAATIARHLRETGRTPAYYDLVVSGDLGRVGVPLAKELLSREGFACGDNFTDCGILLYEPGQDVHAGGSGAACSAVVLGAELWRRLAQGELRRILFVGTGALHNVTTYQQGSSVPGVAHAVAIEGRIGA
jgi:stage V sporulation protein AD